MKREAAAILLLLALGLASCLQQRSLEGLAEEIDTCLTASQAASLEGDALEAAAQLDRAIALWQGAQGWARATMPHPELDGTGQSLYDLKGQLLTGEGQELSPWYEAARRRLWALVDMEGPSLASIF